MADLKTVGSIPGDGTPQPKASCLNRLAVKFGMLSADATPPDWANVGLIFLALLSSALTLTFIFPFLPEMILYLGYSETQKGSIGGYIASMVFAGRVVGSLFWGWLADKRGRKLVLLITIACNGLFALLFGFSRNLAMALIFRFLCGVFNGTVGTAKAILYDISDNSNQALSMSFLAIAWGLGLMVGPLAGGVLASPAKKWPDLIGEDHLFHHFPYLLSSMVPFLACAVIFFIILFKFDETLITRRCDREVCVESGEDTTGTKETDAHTETNPMADQPLLSQALSFQSLHTDLPLTPHAQRRNHHHHHHHHHHHGHKTEVRNRGSLGRSHPDLCDDRDWSSELPQYLSIPNLHHDRSSHDANGVVAKQITASPFSPHPQESREGEGVGKTTDQEAELLLTVGDSGMGEGERVEKASDNKQSNGGGPRSGGGDGEDSASRTRSSEGELSQPDTCGCIIWCCTLPCCTGLRKTTFAQLLSMPDVWMTIMLYCALSFTVIGVDDVFPVFASTRPDYGGMGFSSEEIGLALGAITMPLLFLQIFIYPALVRRLGIRKSFLLCCSISMVFTQLLPLVRLLNNSPVWQWLSLLAVQIPLKITVNCSFAATALLINNSVTPSLAAQVNGLGMTLTAIGRSVAPIFAGSTFSWTVTAALGPPFDISFVFFILGILLFINVILGLKLNPRLDSQRK